MQYAPVGYFEIQVLYVFFFHHIHFVCVAYLLKQKSLLNTCIIVRERERVEEMLCIFFQIIEILQFFLYSVTSFD